jgi:hypothetical protein
LSGSFYQEIWERGTNRREGALRLTNFSPDLLMVIKRRMEVNETWKDRTSVAENILQVCRNGEEQRDPDWNWWEL